MAAAAAALLTILLIAYTLGAARTVLSCPLGFAAVTVLLLVLAVWR